MKTLLPRMVFISAERSDRSEIDNGLASVLLDTTLLRKKYQYISTIGCYKGGTEQSFGVICQAPWSAGMLRLLAKDLDQESIMVREPDGSCWLVYCNGVKEEYIGQWTEVSKERARDLENYTIYHGRIYAAV